MPSLGRWGRLGSRAPRLLLAETNPYASRRVVVEADRVTTMAYLLDASEQLCGWVWLANHVPAPPDLDRSRAADGRPPPMPARWTKHPEGRRPLSRRSFEVVWFEEGDAVALFAERKLLAVIPAGTGDDSPGYAAESRGATPLAWPLDEAAPRLGPWIERSRDFWRWRLATNTWRVYQRELLDHLAERLGAGGRYWPVDDAPLPAVGATEHLPTADRPFTIVSTVGMSCQRMPVPDTQPGDDNGYQHGRIELALATRGPTEDALPIFRQLATYPWRACTWLAHGHHVRLGEGPWVREGHRGVLILGDPSLLPGPLPPDLAGFSLRGDTVRWLWLVPLSASECDLANREGARALVDELSLAGRSWVLGL
ncbi:MAG: suppressor of fused domain protein [Streptosporangiaceae bacterium]